MRLRQEVQALPRRLTALGRLAPGRTCSRLWILVLAGLLLLLASSSYRIDAIDSFDEGVALWVADHMPTWTEWLFLPFHWLGSWMGMTPLSVGAVALLLAARWFADAVWAALAFAGIHILTAVLKEAFDRARPEEGSAVPLPPSDSFPSGHASGAVVTFGLLAVLAAERWPERRRHVWVLVAALVAAIGASRVVLNVHYLTDVPAGYGLGLAWLAACLLARRSGGYASARGRDDAEPRRTARGDRDPARLGP